MNKISKKIVALVTMAAFVLTLVPAAAFAATVEPDNSYIYLSAEKNANVELGERVDYTLELKDAAGQAADTTGKVYIWAEDEEGNVTRYVNFYDAGNGTGKLVSNSLIKVLNSGYALNAGSNYDGRTMAVSFTKDGTYTIHAGYALGDAEITTTSQLVPIASVEGQNTIEVNPAEAAELYQVGVTQNGAQVGSAPVVNKGEVEIAPVLPNNTATKTVTLTTEAEGGSVIANKDLQITTSSKNLTVSAADDNYTTNRKGELELTYKASKAGTYYIYVKNADDNFSATLKVVIPEDSDIVGITATENNAKVIELSHDADFSDAVQIQMTDDQGDVVANNDSRLTAEPIMQGYNANAEGAQNVQDYVTIVSQPKGAKLDYSDVKVVPDSETGNFTIAFADGVTDNDLKEGEYTVQFALLNGDNVQVTFTLAKFGEVKNMIIDVDDTVVAGHSVTGTVKYVDENGIERNADTSVAIGYSGAAFDTSEGASSLSSPSFVVKALNDEKYYGAVITITAVDDYYGKIATADITVTDGVTNGTLAFDPTTGEADKDNTVNVSVVDEDGNVIDTVDNSTIVAYVAETGDADANVTVEPVGNVNNGKGKITVYSDIETTADIVIAVRSTDGKIYAGTLKYTFGAADVNADKIVAMTIGSTDMVVDNNIVTGDAAPYVADGRTMVPIRALTETFGAKVDYDNDAKTVTIVDGDTTVVMTIGETTYTVNGEEKTMDVAPVIGSGDRTYVPVRFVAEALGYKVTPLYAADGTTASVVFQK